MFDMTKDIYTCSEKTREHLESIHWPDGPACTRCGVTGDERITKLKGKSTRPGVYKCKDCRKPFTVTVGTVFERSKIPLNKWVLASLLMAASKKGMSAHQLHRMIGVTYKNAWFMWQRTREAMKEEHPLDDKLGRDGKTIEADETYIGNKDVVKKRTKRGKPSHSSKRSVVALVERGNSVRTFHVDRATKASVRDILLRNASRKSTLCTDESRLYTETGKEFKDLQTVIHSGNEYIRDGLIHTNTIENVFSVFKRSMRGVYQHCGEAHLHRYLAEFSFRYNRRASLKISDVERATDILRGARGKRVTYRRIDQAAYA